MIKNDIHNINNFLFYEPGPCLLEKIIPEKVNALRATGIEKYQNR